jgi:hypothetical protein
MERKESEPVLGPDLIVKGGVPKSATSAGHCEGTYNCTTGSAAFPLGTKSKIGFWSVATCPGSTTLGDGSGWTLIPLTCFC